MSLFDDEFKKLNDAQKEAVQAIDGPVLVIAGPGTGKTQLLSMRVANILRSSDADASNILCLTFTNKAATNMRDRLLTLVGPESNKVTVKTFHGFAAELMNHNPDYFWNGAKLSTAPDAVQLEIVQNILGQLPLSNPLSIRFAGQYTATADVLKALRLAKEAGLTPAKLKSLLELNLAYIDYIEPRMIEILAPTLSLKKIEALRHSIQRLPEQDIDLSIMPLISLRTVILESLDFAIKQDESTGKTKHVGKWKSRWVQTHDGQKAMFDERSRNNWWLALGSVYEVYRDTLHARGYYDYSDMLLEVIVQLEQRVDLRASVQEQYHYVLLDEFQDSNAAQLRLAHLVANHHTSEGAPNIMAVGDDDQSIYGFNGAELNNMLFFDRAYKTPKQIVLDNNYRSSQVVLNVAEKIIHQADDRLVNRVPNISKNLVACSKSNGAGIIQHLSYQTQEHQYSGIARVVQARYNNSSDDNIAVLARGHESLRTLSAILLKLEVPISYEQQTNVLEHEIVKQIILLCELICAINDGDKAGVNEKIAILIQHPMWQFTPSELWQFATDQHTSHSADWLLMLQNSDLSQAIQLAAWLQWLARESSYQPLYVIVEHLLGLVAGQHMTSPIREYYLSKHTITNDYLHGLSAIRLLRELVSEFSSSNTTTAIGVADFVAFIAINRQNNRGITDESPFVNSGRTVKLLTVHKAKGLEFDQVFIIDAVEDSWKPRIAGRKPPANLPLQPPGEKEDDYIRLLYVAVTRAKHSLFITSYRLDSGGREVLATPFIRHVLPETSGRKAEKLPLINVLEENLRWPRLDTKDEKTLLQRRLTNYNLSATPMLTFLDVVNGGPQYFLEKHILRLPEAKSPLQGFGIAMHSALQLAQKLTNQDSFTLKPIIKEYERALHFEHLTQNDHDKYLLHGQETLLKLFETLNYHLPPGSLAEQQFRDIKVGEALLSGTIDRIDKTTHALGIIDYKTGQPLTSFTTRDQTKAIKAWRHKYQLIFYALLAKHHPAYTYSNEIDCAVVYLEAETSKDLIRSYKPSGAEVERMYNLIQAVWNKVIQLDFPDTTDYSKDIAGITQFEEDLLRNS